MAAPPREPRADRDIKPAKSKRAPVAAWAIHPTRGLVEFTAAALAYRYADTITVKVGGQDVPLHKRKGTAADTKAWQGKPVVGGLPDQRYDVTLAGVWIYEVPGTPVPVPGVVKRDGAPVERRTKA
jgi:hypothetical protein